MNALLENVMVGYAVRAVEPVKARYVRVRYGGTPERVALAIAAPLIGLAFVVAFPIVGLAVLAWMGARALARRAKPIVLFARNVALFIAAPFIGLAYALAFPFIGLVMLARWAVRGAVKRYGIA